MTPADFDYLRRLLKERSGLLLSAEKQYLAESRLMPLARKHRLPGLSELIAAIRSGAEPLAIEVVEAMMTSESFFFRDKTPFEHFTHFMMPTLLAARAKKKHIRIWCAAAATGQEPYSLAMALREMGSRIAGYRIDILATDLSTEVLEKAKSGTYSQFEVQRGLPIQMLVKYFTQIGESWRIAPELQSMVSFRPLNLMRDFSRLGVFDIVFCRNVLIYFDQATKINVLERLMRMTAPDGYCVLGAAETVIGLTEAFKPVPERRGIYAPNALAQQMTDRVVRFPQRAAAGGGAS